MEFIIISLCSKQKRDALIGGIILIIWEGIWIPSCCWGVIFLSRKSCLKSFKCSSIWLSNDVTVPLEIAVENTIWQISILRNVLIYKADDWSTKLEKGSNRRNNLDWAALFQFISLINSKDELIQGSKFISNLRVTKIKIIDLII